MDLYHITKEKYLPFILHQGLIVNSKNNGFVKKYDVKYYHLKYGMQPIFLTDNYSYIIKTQLTKKFLNDCILLKITGNSLIIENEYDYQKDETNYFHNSMNNYSNGINTNCKTYICKHNIKHELITFIDNSEWKNTNI